MVLLQTATVSRKTPRDGKLEITAATAHQLGDAGADVRISLNSEERSGSVVTMPCGCKGGISHTTHVFLQCDAFQSLEPESVVMLEMDAAQPSVVRVTPQSVPREQPS